MDMCGETIAFIYFIDNQPADNVDAILVRLLVRLFTHTKSFTITK